MMKNRIYRTLLPLALALFMLLGLVACSAKSKNDMDYKSDIAMGESTESAGSSLTDTLGKTDSETVVDDRKIIETVDMSVQTTEFDVLIEKINAEIASLGGYIESSSFTGREIDSSNRRYANMKVRIPADKSGDFSEFMSENSVVVRKNVTTEDVTLKYVDMESRVAALEAEKESLEILLKNATSVEDIITVREKLTEVIYSIESYKSQLRTYDNLVDYSTIDISVAEVDRTAIVEEQSTWEEIGTNLSNNFEDVWDAAVAVFVFAVSAIPFFIPLIVIAAVIWLIVFICKKSKKRKKAKSKDNGVNIGNNNG